LAVSNLIHGVPVATITYATDVAPHLQRGLMYRRLRLQRRQFLHDHNCERFDAVDPSLSSQMGQFFNLLVEVVAVTFFVVGSMLFSRP
jgi:hypothetical protein